MSLFLNILALLKENSFGCRIYKLSSKSVYISPLKGGILLARKFLSFLGTTDYQACTYKYGPSEDLKWFTKYIQEALLRIFCSDWTKEDTAVIFVTDKAEKLNWYNEDDENRRLKTIMEELNINVKAVSIPEGKRKMRYGRYFI